MMQEATPSMTDNEQVVMQFVEELWNERKLELADVLFNEECYTHQLQSGAPAIGVARGPAEIKAHIAHWLAGYPDLKLGVEQMCSNGDRVFSQMTMDGTQTGEWMGIPATGKRVNIRMMTMHRIQAGKIAEDWVLVESLGLLQQLGALPATSDILSEFVGRLKAQR